MSRSEKIVRAPRLVSLIVVEAGAPWPIPAVGDEELDVDRVVLAQQAGENPLSFSRRVIARVRQLSAEGGSIRLGVLATRDSGSLLALESRYRIACELIEARPRERPAGLVLIGKTGAEPRHDLFALAGSLFATLPDREFYVRVKMAAGPREASPSKGRPSGARLSA